MRGRLLTAVVRGIGAVRIFVLAAVACALTVLAMIAAETAGGWIALWFLTGIAIAAIFTLPEAWVGQLAPEGSHGRPFALSALMARVALVLAPLTPQILAIEGPGLFILSASSAVAAREAIHSTMRLPRSSRGNT
ncbi:MFS transporter [Paenirhodobacter populi]|uniref:hypothetical protein n=1 Tax=Paenirhodobacter populi TaxID=2306993 RepID=UPI000FE43A80|nr:hypothetical protein [Sinirhodobacter populi]RWR10321.1 hypothetical protein D2T32_04760 [Sinirhodobacter populi]